MAGRIIALHSTPGLRSVTYSNVAGLAPMSAGRSPFSETPYANKTSIDSVLYVGALPWRRRIHESPAFPGFGIFNHSIGSTARRKDSSGSNDVVASHPGERERPN